VTSALAVPTWRRMDREVFLDRFPEDGPRLGLMLVPLEVAGALTHLECRAIFGRSSYLLPEVLTSRNALVKGYPFTRARQSSPFSRAKRVAAVREPTPILW
jgi:hypothetical protein